MGGGNTDTHDGANRRRDRTSSRRHAESARHSEAGTVNTHMDMVEYGMSCERGGFGGMGDLLLGEEQRGQAKRSPKKKTQKKTATSNGFAHDNLDKQVCLANKCTRMASTDPQDAASFASTVSLGKRTRSASSPSGNGQEGDDHAGKNGQAQAGEAESDSDDDDVGPMPVPEGADSDDEAGPLPASAKSGAGSSKAAAKRRKILKYEKVYLDNLPSADRYYSGSARFPALGCWNTEIATTLVAQNPSCIETLSRGSA
jgi:hypothetical protein